MESSLLTNKSVRIVIAGTVAVLCGAFLGSLVQTQFNLAALSGLGASFSLGDRLSAMVMDLLSFAPIYAALLAAALIPGFLVTAGLLRLLGLPCRECWFAFGSAMALWATLTLVDSLAPMPTLIAATRSAPGLWAMLATAAVAGWVFAQITKPRSTGGRGRMSLAIMVLTGVAASPEPALAEVPGQVDYQVEVVAQGLDHPWSIAFLSGGAALVTERGGVLKHLSPDGEQTVISGVPAVFASGQAGLFDVLVEPGAGDTVRVFLTYACGRNSANHLCVASGDLTGTELTDVREIFRAKPAKYGNAHYGGRMAWLGDGTLLVTLGDGFDFREEAQRLSSHIGTIVRLNPDGSVPGDNPFINHDGAQPEIFSLGHRNVQGVIYDGREDRIIAHEHGPRGGDEINLIRGGGNYGWPLASDGVDYTGALVTPFRRYEGTIAPLWFWTPSIAPSGMALYHGHQFPQWRGNLFVGALANKSVHRMILADGEVIATERLFDELGERIRDVREGPDGALYLLTDSSEGRLLRVVPRDPPQAQIMALDPQALAWVGDQIFRNECAARHQCLVHWNEGEAFPSLGIGHFIWYPEGQTGPFTESFPALLAFMVDQGVELPAWLDAARSRGAPWPNRAAFLQQASASSQVEALRDLLYSTRGLQVRFIRERADQSQAAVVAAVPGARQAIVRERLWQLGQTPGGVYALMDYVNFKGEGLAETERYEGEGWGLLQVLAGMDEGDASTVLDRFRESAGKVLTRRAQLAENPIERERWLPGWLRRLESYREPE
ncbi:MAG: glucose/sorbosone dehydrogenase family protein [Marinobacter excellens HL-55]|uniref:Glucose/sorbosone dehydrogenase family protein n=1 Tax=Marinobacter excellens HL-55 TaxID=1305731 RepID=A0A0P7ZDJ3_9GAMM|nr:MAG: glucose/sorbosone dehydrogenase family protein [Marinobacter excellens HL-55]